jgi:AraC-like DNA-binding protein/quercetin dioxygenase-like cupin family protein
MHPAQTSPHLELVPVRPDAGYVVRIFQKPRFDVVWHAHPEMEIMLVLEGRGVRYTGRHVEPFHEGDLCFFGPHFPHMVASHPLSERAKWVVIQFLPSMWGEEFLSLRVLSRLRKLLQTRGGLHFGNLPPEHPLYQHLCSMAGHRRLWGLLHLLEELSHLRPVRALDDSEAFQWSNASPDSRLGRILRQIETGDATAERQSEVAKMLGMSSAAFSRFFHRETGRTFQRYCNEVRVARVCADLAGTSDRNIAEAAFAAGFQNLANFGRRFREITGITPSEYRKMLRAEPKSFTTAS